jgi:hypothetical protein
MKKTSKLIALAAITTSLLRSSISLLSSLKGYMARKSPPIRP